VAGRVQASRGDDGRSSTGAGIHAQALGDLEEAYLPPVLPVTAFLKDETT
jgi:hypothetical protein